MKSAEIRQQFLDFFQSKKHTIAKSAPIVLKNDPTLMFTNSGMAQFKDIFLGDQTPKHTRVADTQPCLRVSGKHNDLEDVGKDTYHHTMFEMLGNWSFGDYFKPDAIAWAWEFLTQVCQIPKDRLYVTVFEGDQKENLQPDKEARAIWQQFIDPNRIINGNKKDNFWEMGDVGPCGPCSEIHCDIRTDAERQQTDGKTLVNNDHPQVVEIWNLVFMQFQRMANGSLVELPATHVDTGMGFERLCMVLQNQKSSYDSDVFTPIIQKIETLSGKKYGNELKTDIAFRVIADHIRAITFIIADGQLPSNNKQGYVCKRILRRAVRYGYTYLALEKPFLFELVEVLAMQFEGVFDQIAAQKDFIKTIVQKEEEAFLITLKLGINRLDEVKNNLNANNLTQIDGKTSFELYDTFGFPIDLTRLIAQENGLTIDEQGFETQMKQQKMRGKKDAEIEKTDWVECQDAQTLFVGYDTLQCETQIVKYRTFEAKGNTNHQIVLQKTPFYAESGGQSGDFGLLTNEYETIEILNTIKENNLIIHQTNRLPTKLNAYFVAKVDAKNRQAISNNHSATHLMHAALRLVLGKHVEQKGSMVNHEVLRFDFSHFNKLTNDQIVEVERLVNQKISDSILLTEERSLPIEEAKKRGAMALFGEKYGDFVRVITFDPDFSVEFCGGTHVENTAKIGWFKIVGESSIASGVRRIEALTNQKAVDFIANQLEIFDSVKQLLKNPADVAKSIEQLLEQNHQLSKQLEHFETEKVMQMAKKMGDDTVQINGINFLTQTVEVNSVDSLRKIASELKKNKPHLLLVLGAKIDHKVSVIIALSDDFPKDKGLNAAHLVKEISTIIDGNGGGQAFLATAGGKNASALPEVYAHIKSKII